MNYGSGLEEYVIDVKVAGHRDMGQQCNACLGDGRAHGADKTLAIRVGIPQQTQLFKLCAPCARKLVGHINAELEKIES